MRELREAIASDSFAEWRAALAATLRPNGRKERGGGAAGGGAAADVSPDRPGALDNLEFKKEK
ncbi:MAG: queuine tRNA-ribosyltransferase family protein, partial [Candidatus Accumulibacter sp.]|jgi:hypothetical protein|nr:queuine tRNA-ribosyltransferase family protein [Accumulibacter sp.]